MTGSVPEVQVNSNEVLCFNRLLASAMCVTVSKIRSKCLICCLFSSNLWWMGSKHFVIICIFSLSFLYVSS